MPEQTDKPLQSPLKVSVLSLAGHPARTARATKGPVPALCPTGVAGGGRRSRLGSQGIAEGPGQEGLAGPGLSDGLCRVLGTSVLCFSVPWSLRSETHE